MIDADCLSDDALVAVHFGDGPEIDARHATACLGCARRLAALRADLGRIRTVLATAPPRRRAARVPLAMFVPLVVAAAAALLVFVWTTRASRELAALSTIATGDEASFLDDVALALSPAATDEQADTDASAESEPSALEIALGDESTCDVDEPFWGVGCNDDDTRLAALER